MRRRLLLPGWWRPRQQPQWSSTAHLRIGIPAPRPSDWDLWSQELQERTTS